MENVVYNTQDAIDASKRLTKDVKNLKQNLATAVFLRRFVTIVKKDSQETAWATRAPDWSLCKNMKH